MSTDRSVRAINSSRSSGVGSFGNATIQRDVDPFNDKVKRSLDGEKLFDDGSPRFEDWSPAKQRAAYEGLARGDEKNIARSQVASAFLQLHPEFIDIDTNAQILTRTLHALFGDVAFTIDQFAKGYEVCRANNSLQLDQAEIVKQQQAVANQRAKAAREQHARETRVFSEDEKENMSLEELREAENREIRRRMQEAGERGGNGF
jgi:hypothetical protein